MPHPAKHGTFLLSALLLCSCASTHRLAGSMQITADHPAVLRIESAEPANLQMELWSRGPQDVRFQQQAPVAIEPSSGTLTTDGQELHWSATTRQLQVALTVAQGEATIGYVIRSDRGVSLSLGSQ